METKDIPTINCFDNLSVVVPYRRYDSSCGYCGSKKGRWAFGMDTTRLTCPDYQRMIDHGWRRSGTFCYLPDNAKSCCPNYTIRLDVTKFQCDKKQRKLLRKAAAFCDADAEADSASGSSGGKGGNAKQLLQWAAPVITGLAPVIREAVQAALSEWNAPESIVGPVLKSLTPSSVVSRDFPSPLLHAAPPTLPCNIPCLTQLKPQPRAPSTGKFESPAPLRIAGMVRSPRLDSCHSLPPQRLAATATCLAQARSLNKTPKEVCASLLSVLPSHAEATVNGAAVKFPVEWAMEGPGLLVAVVGNLTALTESMAGETREGSRGAKAQRVVDSSDATQGAGGSGGGGGGSSSSETGRDAGAGSSSRKKHRLVVDMVPAAFEQESFDLYKKYQVRAPTSG